MGEREITIDFSELSRIEVYCPACKGGCLIDWKSQEAFPQQCGVCGTQFSESARRAMASHQQFYKAAKDSKLTFRFRVREP
jgi:hypothetical protein